MWITGGSPSLARSRRIVVFTVVVNGSAASSHTRSSSSSADTSRPAAASRHSSTANSFGLRSRRRPARDATRRLGSRVRSPLLQDRRQRRRRAAAQRPDPGHQLGEVERLGQVVVGAQAEAVDPLLARCSAAVSISTRLAGVRGDDPPAHLVAVHAGQVPVEHHHVVPGDRQVLERVVAVEDHVDRHALAAQPGADRPGQDLEVFDDQHSHAPTMPGPRWQPGVGRWHRADTAARVEPDA